MRSIASALPWIASDFGEVSQLNWIVSSFNLTSSAAIPLWAQMADVFGRNVTINAAIVLMLVGSALCTGAPTSAFPVLLLGRGFQGLAAAGLNVVVRTILADRVSLQENAKNWSIFALVGGASYGLGPVIGGESKAQNEATIHDEVHDSDSDYFLFRLSNQRRLAMVLCDQFAHRRRCSWHHLLCPTERASWPPAYPGS